MEERLIDISLKLIRGFHWLSTDPREMPPKTPLIILREICRELEQRQIMGVDIKEIAQKVSELEEYAPLVCKLPTSGIGVLEFGLGPVPWPLAPPFLPLPFPFGAG